MNIICITLLKHNRILEQLINHTLDNFSQGRVCFFGIIVVKLTVRLPINCACQWFCFSLLWLSSRLVSIFLIHSYQKHHHIVTLLIHLLRYRLSPKKCPRFKWLLRSVLIDLGGHGNTLGMNKIKFVQVCSFLLSNWFCLLYFYC